MLILFGIVELTILFVRHFINSLVRCCQLSIHFLNLLFCHCFIAFPLRGSTPVFLKTSMSHYIIQYNGVLLAHFEEVEQELLRGSLPTDQAMEVREAVSQELDADLSKLDLLLKEQLRAINEKGKSIGVQIISDRLTRVERP